MEHSDTIFGKIIRREIPADIVYETDTVLGFRDINPQAPTHILLIPKKFIRDVSSAKKEDKDVLGDLMLAVTEVVKKEGIEDGGYRVVINNGASAGQTVFHLHLHLLAGREFRWPPG